MNKKDLINVIAEQAQISKASAKLALDATLDAISNALANGDKVSLIGFGTFSVAERGARQGVNPATKQAIEIPAKKVAKFKAGAELAEKVN
ncbi:MAG: HU family DNA-binding protein [Paludibacteraceae bacterium]|nr:HU family DNA-binding protein [Paludibacteraceae bacterium]